MTPYRQTGEGWFVLLIDNHKTNQQAIISSLVVHQNEACGLCRRVNSDVVSLERSSV